MVHPFNATEICGSRTDLEYFCCGDRVPKASPPPRDHRRLEEIMLVEIDASGSGPAEFDHAIWSHYASGGTSQLPRTAA